MTDRDATGRPEPHLGITRREREVLVALADGLTAGAIGRRLQISPLTVRKHLEHVYAKLGCHDRLVAVRRAEHLGLVPYPTLN